MKPRLLLLSALTFLTACGTSGTIAPPAAASRNLTGDWQIQSAPPSVATPAAGILLLGSLTSSGSSVTGTFRLANFVTPNACGTPLQQIVTVSGTVDADRNLSLTSAPFSGSVLSVQLLVPSVLTSFGSGTILISGGNCTFASSAAIAVQTVSVTGTYTGPVTSTSTSITPTISSGNASLTLMQSSTPNADGQFAVSGSLTFAGGSCTSSIALTGTVSGGQITLASASTGLFTLSAVRVNAFALPTAASLTAASILYTPDPCNTANLAAQYQGTLTRQ